MGILGQFLAGKESAGATRDAAQTQAESAAQGVAEQRRQFDQTRADQAPWLDAGKSALDRLNRSSTGDMSDFHASPDYQFTRDEGTRGIASGFAAKGGAFSGNALKALSEFNSNLASSQYGNWWNKNAGLAGVGQTSANSLGVLGQNNANNISGLLAASGNARASGIIGTQSVWNNAFANESNNAAKFFGGGGWKQFGGGNKNFTPSGSNDFGMGDGE